MIPAGVQAERLAARFLEAQGLKLVERNYRSRFGEIDLVMRDAHTLVFVEVRLRSHGGFGGAAASVDRRKQQRLIATAQQYLSTLPAPPPCRFDVVLMSALQGTPPEWLRNAFEA
jgi:putative endonuclease